MHESGKNQFKRRNLLTRSLLLSLAALIMNSGCATGLWKPVKPWNGGNRWQQDVPFATPETGGVASEPAPSIDAAAPMQNSPPTATTVLPNRTIHRGNAVSGVTSGTPATGVFDPFATRPPVPQQPSSTAPAASPSTTQPAAQPADTNRPQFEPEEQSPTSTQQTTFFRSQSPEDHNGGAVQIPATPGNGSVQQTAAQFPELNNNGRSAGNPVSPFLGPSINSGSPNDVLPAFQPNAPSGSVTFPQNYADLDIYLSEVETGRINFGGAYNSDSGLVGQFVIDERNFDIARFPRNFREIVDGTAWRGGGQNFRLELVPGNDVERYLVSFSEPFLFNSAVSLSTSLFYYQRQFFDYDEERLGGRFAFGYRLTPDISVSTGLRMENVDISDPRVATSPQLNAALGDTDLYVANVSLIRDTRDHPFLPTEGNYLSLMYSQGFGEFDFPRGDIDFRTYRLMYQRPDGSGRHTLSYGTRLGFSGAQTPLFENYFAGGFSTMRGFDFRGASPIEGGVRVGGEFQWLNTVEYIFPLTADDMIRGVLFTDFGTVEEEIALNSDNFRIAPGFGFRVHMPAAGIGAPLAFDFAFPVAEAAGDDKEVFSFYIGVGR